MKPDARRDQILLEEVGDELVVYDQKRHRVHHLNRTAALVWQSCDGHKTVGDLKKVLQAELNPKADEAVVWKALDRLGKAQLLRQAVAPPAGITRRQAFGKFGKVAALALLAPVVKSIVAPTPVKAAFGGPVFSCGSFFCSGVYCRDQCQGDFQCPGFAPFCRVVTCQQFPCAGCSQRVCVTSASPFRAPSRLDVKPDATRTKKG